LLQRSIGVVVDRSWLSPVAPERSHSIRRIA
jgi:hypothetical protein